MKNLNLMFISSFAIITFFLINLPQFFLEKIDLDFFPSVLIDALVLKITYSFFIIIFWIIMFKILYKRGYGFIGIYSYLLFLLYVLVEKVTYIEDFKGLTLTAYLSYTFLIIVLLIFIDQKISFYNWGRQYLIAFSFFISYILSIIPLCFLGYSLNFNSKATPNTFFAIFQSNFKESSEFMESLSEKTFIYVFCVILIMTYFLFKGLKSEKSKIQTKKLSMVLVVLLMISGFHIKEYNLIKKPFFYISIIRSH